MRSPRKRITKKGAIKGGSVKMKKKKTKAGNMMIAGVTPKRKAKKTKSPKAKTKAKTKAKKKSPSAKVKKTKRLRQIEYFFDKTLPTHWEKRGFPKEMERPSTKKMKAWASKYKKKEDLTRLKAVLATYKLMGRLERRLEREEEEEVVDNIDPLDRY